MMWCTPATRTGKLCCPWPPGASRGAQQPSLRTWTILSGRVVWISRSVQICGWASVDQTDVADVEVT